MLNPDRCIEQVRALRRTLAGAYDDWEIELYHRLSRTIRSREADGAGYAGVLMGEEDGVAMRARSRRDGSTAFAACSGLDPAPLGRELHRVTRLGGSPTGGEGESWNRSGSGVSIDREEALELPDPDELSAWLERARDEMQGPRGRHRRVPRPVDCRVEVAVVVETWVADDGSIASRARRRGWGMVRPGAEPEESMPRPIVVAARRWEDLPAEGWRTVLEDRWIGGPSGAAGRILTNPGSLPVLFNPECAAVVGRALVRALQDPGSKVASAWKVTDDPTDPEALFGGTFDDAGYPTARNVLWRKGRTAGRSAGAGHYRRPSFRDPPTSMPAHLLFEVEAGALPPRVLLVTRLSLHPLAPDNWGLEVDGAALDGGQPSARLRGAFIPTSPAELAARCVASVGPQRTSHLGVRTAALLFDRLDVR